MGRAANPDAFASVLGNRRGADAAGLREDAERRGEDAARRREEAALRDQLREFFEEHSECSDFDWDVLDADPVLFTLERTHFYCLHDEGRYDLTAPTDMAKGVEAELYEKRWGRPKQQHEWEDDGDGGFYCVKCSAVTEDAYYGDTGCEASPEGNPPWYAGFALTPEEQAQGITTVQKGFLFNKFQQEHGAGACFSATGFAATMKAALDECGLLDQPAVGRRKRKARREL
jgi:hypothetical protein